MTLESDLPHSDPDLSQDVSEGLISLSSHQLRKALRDIVTKFNSSVIPVRPSPSEILTPFMLETSKRFVSVTTQISEALASGANVHDDDVSELFNERDELCSVAIASEDFKTYRSSRMAEHNSRVARFNEMQDIIVGLKPFLGMPSLPDIRVPSIDPAVLLSAIKGVATREPMSGQMVLRVDEPYYKRHIFYPFSIADVGIDPRLASDFAPVPYSLDSNQAKCADSFGAILKNNAFAFPLSKGRPAFEGEWRDIDSFLPFALRSLCVPVVPLVLPQSSPDLRDIFRSDTVEALKGKALEVSNSLCVYCGSSHDVDAIGIWRFREPLEGATPIGVQILSHIWPACGECRSALRPSPVSLGMKSEKGESSINPESKIVDRLALLNHWPSTLATEYARSAYATCAESHKRRSLLRWVLDLKSINRQYLVLKEGLTVSSSGWVNDNSRRNGESSFRLSGAGIHETSSSRFFIPSPSIFDVKWDDTIESVGRRLEDYDLAVIEKIRPEDAFVSIADTASITSAGDIGPDREEPQEGAFASQPPGAGLGLSNTPQRLGAPEETFLIPPHLADFSVDEEEKDPDDVDDEAHVSKPSDDEDDDFDDVYEEDKRDKDEEWVNKYS